MLLLFGVIITLFTRYLSDLVYPATMQFDNSLDTPTEANNDLRNPSLRYCIIIPAWNESDLIQQTIESVLEAQAEQHLTGEIIVVDNNSTDDTAAKAKDLGVTVVFEPINQIARARNTGASATNADFLIFLDADSQINSTLLAMTLQALISGRVIGGGSIVTLDREIKGSPMHMLNLWNWWSQRIGAAAGCYFFCTREAFNAVGGFNEKQYAAEELKLSRRLRKYAKAHSREFVIFSISPVVSSARKLDWYSKRQKLTQLLLLFIPGATRSRKMLGMWYDRSRIREKP